MFKWKRLLLIVGFLLCIIIVQSRNENITGPFKGLIGNILNPFVYITNGVLSGVSDLWNSYFFLVGVQAQNDEYREIINRLTLENSLLREKNNRNERIYELLRFNDAYNFSTLSSNVIGASEGYIRYIIIDMGSSDGVKKDDPVIGFHGLVGKVSRTFSKTSEVSVILNVSSNVSVMNSRTRAVGILRGDGRGHLSIDYYDRLDNVQEGDEIITSGLGRLFPKGIAVGKVSKVVKTQSGLFQNVFVEQNEDFYKLENVFVVKNFEK